MDSGMLSGQVVIGPPGTAEQPALCSFGDRWKLDGDYLRCRGCNRPQILSYALRDFPHASGCKGAGWDRNPWVTLSSLITAGISRAKEPADAT